MIKKCETSKAIVIYGTVRECVDYLWKTIDIEEGKFIDFDFAAEVPETDNAYDAFANSSYWFGCKNIAKMFDSDNIVAAFGMYGGGGNEIVELCDDYVDVKEDFIRKLCEATENCGVELSDTEKTVFELFIK